MSAVFMVSGFYNDDRTEFNRLLVTDMDCTPSGWRDEDIFYYGIPENELLGRHDDFTITAYDVYERTIA